MIYLYKKGKLKVKIAFSKKDNDELLVLNESGDKILEKYEYAQLKWMAKGGLLFSAICGISPHLRYRELYFAYFRNETINIEVKSNG